ncbi:MAG: hypothetical protein QOG14_1725, partial [Mycobacterium sp.]|nr:hypothetical protein [Mycobacterium sp.]
RGGNRGRADGNDGGAGQQQRRSIRCPSFRDVTPQDTPERMPASNDQHRSAAKGLNVGVADLVEASQDRICPMQFWLNWWRRRGVRRQLLRDDCPLVLASPGV